MKNIIVIAIIIAFAGGGFFAGMKYQQGKQPFRGMRQLGDLPAGAQQRMGAGTVRGEIISQDDKSITVKLPDGSSKIVLISENTEINKATEAVPDDLTVGEEVMVFGSTNSNGSASATQIQLN